jgi:hypothetical protein
MFFAVLSQMIDGVSPCAVKALLLLMVLAKLFFLFTSYAAIAFFATLFFLGIQSINDL